MIHGFQLIFCAITLIERHRVGVRFHLFHMAGHQQLHKVARLAVARLAFHQNLINIAIINIANGPFDQVAILINQSRSLAFQRRLTNVIPKPRQIIKVALNFGLCALQPGGADDAAHGGWQVEFRHDRLQPLAIRHVGDFPANPAAMSRVGHQYAIASGERQIGGERRALIAALFLHYLNQQDLAAMNDILNFIATAQRHTLAAQIFSRAIILAIAASGFRGGWRITIHIIFQLSIGAIIVAAIIVMMAVYRVFIPIIGAQGGFCGRVLGFFAQQGFAIFLGDLVIIGVNFRKGQKAMPVPAIIDERRLKRRFNPRYFGEVNIAFELPALCRFEIKFLNPVSLNDRNPCFLRVAGVDQHPHCHSYISVRDQRRPTGRRARKRDGQACALCRNYFVKVPLPQLHVRR